MARVSKPRPKVRKRLNISEPPKPPVKPKPTPKPKPRSTSAKQGGQAARFANAPKAKPAPKPKPKPKPTPKPAPKPKPSVGKAIGKAAVDAAKVAINFANPAKKVTIAAGALAAAKAAAVKISGSGAVKATSQELVKRPGALVLHPTLSTRAIAAANKNMTRNRAAISIGGGAAALTAGGTISKYNTSSNASKTTTKTPAKKIPGMNISAARQEVAMTKRAQASSRAAKNTPIKRVTAKQTAYRQTRRWGTSREAFQLAKANRNRPRG